MKRTYVKKSSYWNRFEEPQTPSQTPIQISNASFEPELVGEPFYVSDASVKPLGISRASYERQSSSPRTSARANRAAFTKVADRFSSIRNGMLPYTYSTDGVNVKEAIELCQKAYANVAIFRNAIDVMSEFANTDIYFEDGSQKSKDFFTEWFKKIKIWDLKDQYFREYYRGGNIFLYRIDAKFQADHFAKVLRQVGGISSAINKIPVRYVMLNPCDIIAKAGTTFGEGCYEKIFSQYEILRLLNPASEEDKEVFEGLPQQVKNDIKNKSFTKSGVKIELDPTKLCFSFYKKQDYEPFAVPFGYPVLEDINAKLELKKMDQAITRTVENVILLITMGAKPEDGGINANNLTAMQNLFKNESVGRVLVSDYTTKAQFIIPDLNNVLGPEKYQVLNEDIKQGLQNIIVGEEKYSATEVKAQIFVDRLKEARISFLNDFLIPEMKRVSKDLGMKNFPTPKFRDIDIRDQGQLMKVTTRLVELGVLTPQQGMDMFHTGEFPKSEDISPAQEEFAKERKKGFYNPIVGGVPVIPPPKDPNAVKPASAPKLNKTRKAAGRPNGSTGIPVSKSSISINSLKEILLQTEALKKFIADECKKTWNLDSLSEAQNKMVEKLSEQVVTSSDIKTWELVAASCVKDCENISSLSVKPEILDILSEYELESDYEAALIYHSQNS